MAFSFRFGGLTPVVLVVVSVGLVISKTLTVRAARTLHSSPSVSGSPASPSAMHLPVR